jgi:hypothetical protein
LGERLFDFLAARDGLPKKIFTREEGGRQVGSRMNRGIIALIAFVAVMGYELSYQVNNAFAIPAFARKYNFACNMCHVPSFPKLNDFGNQFRDKGYQLKTEEELPTWEGLSRGYWPVALRTTTGYQFQTTSGLPDSASSSTNVKATSGTFGFTGLDILSFGILARDISFGVVYVPQLGSAGFGTQDPATIESGDLEAVFIRLDNLFGSSLMNLKVGKYELDLPFSVKRSPTLNTDFLMYTYTAGVPVLGGVGGATNPNTFALSDNHLGAEMFGIKESLGGYLRYSLNALSNSDLNKDTTGGGRALQLYGHATQSFGGYGIVSGQRVGLLGMYGQAPTRPSAAGLATAGAGTGEGNEPFWRIGVDASTTWKNQVNIFGAWMYAQDSQDLFLNSGGTPVGVFQDAHWHGGFVEADYNPAQFSKWLLIYRYDWITNTKQPDTGFPGNFNNVQQHTLAARYNFHFSTRTDIAAHIEYSHLSDRQTAAAGGDQLQQTFLAGFDFAL